MVKDVFQYIKISGTKYTSTFSRVINIMIEFERILKVGIKIIKLRNLNFFEGIWLIIQWTDNIGKTSFLHRISRRTGGDEIKILFVRTIEFRVCTLNFSL
jgi:hypothetical protein